MGAQCCCQSATEEPLETLRFHTEAKGLQVQLNTERNTAIRCATFHDGIVFSQRPVRPHERVTVRILQYEKGWQGGLRVGFTRMDPGCVSAPCLPRFLCPDLELQSPTWGATLPQCCLLAGSVVHFWVNKLGWLIAEVNARVFLVLRKDVAMGAPLWAVMDLYGATKAIELVDTTTSTLSWITPSVLSDDCPGDPENTGQECAICFHHAVNTVLVPCGHSDFCSRCALRLFMEAATCPMCRLEIKDVAPLRTT